MGASVLNLAVSQWQSLGVQISLQPSISALRVVTDTVNGFMERISPSVDMDRALWADSLKEVVLDMVTRVSPFQTPGAANEGSVRAFLDGLKRSEMNSRVTTFLGDLPPASEAMLKGLQDLYDPDKGFPVASDEKGRRRVAHAEAVGRGHPSGRGEEGFLFGLELVVEHSLLSIDVKGAFAYPRSPAHWNEFLDPMCEDIPVVSEFSIRRYFELVDDYFVFDPNDEVWIVGSLEFLGDDKKRNGSSAWVSLERPLFAGKGAVSPYRLTKANFYDIFSSNVDLFGEESSDAAFIRKVSRLLSQQISSFGETSGFFSRT